MFLCLAALYESWSVPFSVILVVPLGIVGALLFTGAARADATTCTSRSGLLTTVGLSSKNAILIVEFAKQLQEQGKSVVDATLEAVRLRLRPDPDDLAGLRLRRAAAGHRHRRGRGRPPVPSAPAVLGGMVVGTVLGIFFVPLFFVLIRGWLEGRRKPQGPSRTSLRARTAEQGGH